MKRSLRVRLLILWLLIAVICVALGLLMLGLYNQGAAAQVRQGQELAETACEAIQDRYTLYANGYADSAVVVDARTREDLEILLGLALNDYPGVEGGVWLAPGDFLAYAYPTYEGSGVKRDVPEAEKPRIDSLARQALARNGTQRYLQQGEREALIGHACLLPAPPENLLAWTLLRMPASSGEAYDRLMLGLATLLGFVILSGIWLGWLLNVWTQQLTRLAHALDTHPIEHFPQLDTTGEQELDRIVLALNAFSQRLNEERVQSAELSRQLAQADRLGALGRMAAGIAHEIRNPIAAMRLKAENAIARNALSGDDDPAYGQQHEALAFILRQIERLDRLLTGLLSMTQELRLQFAPVQLAPWLAERLAAVRDRANNAGVALNAETRQAEWVFDAAHLARALDNLLINAIQHTPAGGAVMLTAEAGEQRLTIRVSDTGAGVAAAVREHIFEPFVTGRADGTGLGLAVVREIVAAHGGEARCVDAGPGLGSRFEMELPWRAS